MQSKAEKFIARILKDAKTTELKDTARKALDACSEHLTDEDREGVDASWWEGEKADASEVLREAADMMPVGAAEAVYRLADTVEYID